jgi:hypothetical protein
MYPCHNSLAATSSVCYKQGMRRLMTKRDKQRLAYLRAIKRSSGVNGVRWAVWGLTFESTNAGRAAEKIAGFEKGMLNAS